MGSTAVSFTHDEVGDARSWDANGYVHRVRSLLKE